MRLPRPVVESLWSFWSRGHRVERAGYVVGLFLVISGLIHLAILVIGGGSWEGPVSLRKATIFGVSFGVTLITIAWACRSPPGEHSQFVQVASVHTLLVSFWRSTSVAPLIVMTVVWILVRSAGMIIPWPQADSWGGALRFALAAMFAFTAISHFHPRIRPDLIRMVPSSLPAAPLLVTATGILELFGATGLLIPSVRTAAAYCLVALLIALFPANVHAARAGLHVAGRPAASLTWRLPLQLFWAACLLWVA